MSEYDIRLPATQDCSVFSVEALAVAGSSFERFFQAALEGSMMLTMLRQ
jgi:hypothetical protein